MIDLNQLAKQAKQLGAAASGIIKPSDLRISEEFRTLCEQNTCGKYGTTWMCPPNIAPFEEVKAKVLGYTEGVVFQTVHALEDSFDYEGMLKGVEITVASPAGGQPPLDPKSDESDSQTDATRRFKEDPLTLRMSRLV